MKKTITLLFLLFSSGSNALDTQPQYEVSEVSAPVVSEDALLLTDGRTVSESFDIVSSQLTGSGDTIVTYDIFDAFGTVFRRNDSGAFEQVANFDLRELDDSADEFDFYSIQNAVLVDESRLLIEVNFSSQTTGSVQQLSVLNINQDNTLTFEQIQSTNFSGLGFNPQNVFIDGNSVLTSSGSTIIAQTLAGTTITDSSFAINDFFFDSFWVNAEENLIVVAGGAFFLNDPLLRIYEYSLDSGDLELTLVSEILNEVENSFNEIEIVRSSNPNQFATFKDPDQVLSIYEVNDTGDLEIVRTFSDTTANNSFLSGFRFEIDDTIIHDDFLVMSDFRELSLVDISSSELGSTITQRLELNDSFVQLFSAEQLLYGVSDSDPTQQLIVDSNAIVVSPIEEQTSFDLSGLNNAVILEEQNLVLALTDNRYNLYDVSADMPVLIDSLSAQASSFNITAFDNALVSIDFDNIFIVEITQTESGEFVIEENTFEIIEEDGSLSFVSAGFFDYDSDEERIITTDFSFSSSLVLLERQDDQFVIVTRLVDGVNNIDNLGGISSVTLQNDSVYVTSSSDSALVKFNIENGSLVQASVLTGLDFFSNTSEIITQFGDDRFYVKTEDFIASFGTEGELSLLSVTLAVGDIVFLDEYHALVSPFFFNQAPEALVFRVDLETGIWTVVDTIDSNISTQDTAVAGNSLYQLESSGFNAATILSIQTLQRAPVSFRQNNSVAYNQGNEGSIALSELFVDVDENDALGFSLETNASGLILDGDTLIDDGTDSFGSQTLIVRATDLLGQYSETNVTVDVNRRPQLAQSVIDIDVQTNENFSLDLADFAFDDQDQFITFIALADLPVGVTLDDSVLSGSLASATSTTIDVTVEDNLGAQNTISVNLSATTVITDTDEPSDDGDGGGSLSLLYLLCLLGLVWTRRKNSI